jgi:hypothetical protein
MHGVWLNLPANHEGEKCNYGEFAVGAKWRDIGQGFSGALADDSVGATGAAGATGRSCSYVKLPSLAS